MRFDYITYFLMSTSLIISWPSYGIVINRDANAYNNSIPNDAFLDDERLLLNLLDSSRRVGNSLESSDYQSIFKLIHHIVNRKNTYDSKSNKSLPILDKDFLIFKLLKIYNNELSHLSSSHNWKLFNEITEDLFAFLSSYSNTRELYLKLFLENLVIISTRTHLPIDTCSVIQKQIWQNILLRDFKNSLKVTTDKEDEEGKNAFFNLNTVLAFWLICINNESTGKAELYDFCKENHLRIEFSKYEDKFSFHSPSFEALCRISSDYKIDITVKNTYTHKNNKKILHCTIDNQEYNLTITKGPSEIYSLATQLHAKILDSEYRKISFYISDSDLLRMKRLLGYDMFSDKAFLDDMKRSIPQALYNTQLLNAIIPELQEINHLKNIANNKGIVISSNVISNYIREKKILEFWGNKVDKYNIMISNIPIDKRVIDVVKKLSPISEKNILEDVWPELLQKIK